MSDCSVCQLPPTLLQGKNKKSEGCKRSDGRADRCCLSSWWEEFQELVCVCLWGERASKQQTETVCQTFLCCLNTRWSEMEISFWFTVPSLRISFALNVYLKASHISKWIKEGRRAEVQREWGHIFLLFMSWKWLFIWVLRPQRQSLDSKWRKEEYKRKEERLKGDEQAR